VLESHATRIDEQKLRVSEPRIEGWDWLNFFQAIGLRMTCENEADSRSRQKKTLQALINEKKAELDRWRLLSLSPPLTLPLLVDILHNVNLWKELKLSKKSNLRS
jgi:hypothetical protein